MTPPPGERPPLPYATLRTADEEPRRPRRNWIAFVVGFLIVACAAVALVVLLTPPTVPAPPEQQQTPERAYVSAAVPLLPNADVRSLGHRICDGLQSGLTLPQVAQAMQSTTDLSDADANRIASLAVAAYCPEQSGG